MDSLVNAAWNRTSRWLGWNWSWSGSLVVLLVLLAAAVVHLNPEQPDREVWAAVAAARLNLGQLEVLVELATCDLALRVIAVEATDRVAVRASVRSIPSDLACAAVVSYVWTDVLLRRPLGTRQVVDADSGQPVPLIDCHALPRDARC